MNKSPKNILQEIFQKVGQNVPRYSSKISNVGIKGTNKPLWRSIVTVHDGTKFEGDEFAKKIDAENSAAVYAINYYQASTRRTGVLVELDMFPNFLSKLDNFGNNQVIYVFVNEKNPLHNESGGIISMMSPDPAVHMSMCLGMMLHLESFDEYVIASSNAETLVKMVSQPYMGWVPKVARTIEQVSR